MPEGEHVTIGTGDRGGSESLLSPLSITRAIGAPGEASQTLTLAQIIGAEVMRVGTWNGNKFTLADLQDIASAAPEQGYIPPLKIGHDESVGARAWGWIRNLRVAGEALLADLMDIPDSLAAIIRERGYDQLSAEVYLHLNRDGKKFRRALKAVVLLGAEIPAVSNLKPLRELFSGSSAEAIAVTGPVSFGLIRPLWTVTGPQESRGRNTFDFIRNHLGGPSMPDNTEDTSALKAEVARLKQEHENAAVSATAASTLAEEQKALLATQATELVKLKADAELQSAEVKKQAERSAALEAHNREIKLAAKLQAWKGPPAFRPFLEALWSSGMESPGTLRFNEAGKAEDVSLESVTDKLAEMITTKTSWMLKQLSVVPSTDNWDDPGSEVDTRTKALMEKESSLTYQQAEHRVLNSDPALKSAYAGM